MMTDSYLTISTIAIDHDMRNRIASCAAQQGNPSPEKWSWDNAYIWAATPTWAEKWDYALAFHPEPEFRPGADPSVITDGDILSRVQQMLAVPEPV
jgi:hypothetical protein